MQPGKVNCVMDIASRDLPSWNGASLNLTTRPQLKSVSPGRVCALKRGSSFNGRWNAPPDAGRWQRILFSTVCAIVSVAMSCGASPAVASPSTKTAPGFRHTETDHARKDGSKGPLQIIISINQQKLHLYSDGVHVADAPVATGVPITRRRSAFSASSRKAAITAPISTATRRCRLWNASPGRASRCTKVSIWATRLRMAVSACRMNSPRDCGR